MQEANGQKFLILGASSFIGRRLYREMGIESAVGTYCQNPIETARYYDSEKMDVADIIEDDEEYSHAIILLGNTQPDSCFANPVQSHALNVQSIIRLIDSLHSMNIVPVFLSSQFVFDGEKGKYVEEDEVNPILLYGSQKVVVEHYLEDNIDDFLILRLGNVYGDDSSDGTLFTSWMDSLSEGVRYIKCASDQRFSATHVADVVQAILATIENGCTGTFHVAGPVGFSRSDLLMILLAKLNERVLLDVEVEFCSIQDFGLPEVRPRDVTLCPNRLTKETGITLITPEGFCERIVYEYVSNGKMVGD